MRKARRNSRLAVLAMPLLLAVATLAKAQEADIEDGGVVINLDNDLFGAGSNDRDYSWGLSATFGSPGPGRMLAPLEAARRSIASLVPANETAAVSRASQAGVIAMTPDDLKASKAQPEDRPYASLLYLTSSELRVAESGDRSRFTSFTVGVLGTDVAEDLQRAVHHVQAGVAPKGWDHQISDGGEPTARYVHAEQWLVGDTEAGGGSARQTKLTLAGSAGYLTEASAALSLRWGRIATPWWSFNPELGDYTPAPVAPVNDLSFGASPEIYGFVGARVKARAYNALLQGQFRHSEVRVGSDDLARFQAEAWAGLTSVISDWRVTYSVHVASREINHKPADRMLVWAGVSLSRAF